MWRILTVSVDDGYRFYYLWQKKEGELVYILNNKIEE
jgi:hypothetical protein